MSSLSAQYFSTRPGTSLAYPEPTAKDYRWFALPKGLIVGGETSSQTQIRLVGKSGGALSIGGWSYGSTPANAPTPTSFETLFYGLFIPYGLIPKMRYRIHWLVEFSSAMVRTAYPYGAPNYGILPVPASLRKTTLHYHEFKATHHYAYLFMGELGDPGVAFGTSDSAIPYASLLAAAQPTLELPAAFRDDNLPAAQAIEAAASDGYSTVLDFARTVTFTTLLVSTPELEVFRGPRPILEPSSFAAPRGYGWAGINPALNQYSPTAH
jgi:hypothetical protein